jgi:hypothetical protein
MDRSARILARSRQPASDVPRHGPRLGPIALDVYAPNGGRRYNVRAGLLRGAEVASGDLVSTASCPLIRHEGTVDLEVAVKPIA